MFDPYSVLGIDRAANDDEIKKAYRNLSRRYHPDANINNPNKAQAEEKFKEIQQAYDQIMKEKEMGSSYRSGNNSYGNNGYGFNGFEGFNGFGGFSDFGGFNGSTSRNEDEETIHMRAAINYINSRHFAEALNVLNSISNRNSNWYYLSAIANAGTGNNILALEQAKQALSMEPDNRQYANLVYQLESGGNWYQNMQNPYGNIYSGDNCCMKLCLANLLCNMCCCGGCC